MTTDRMVDRLVTLVGDFVLALTISNVGQRNLGIAAVVFVGLIVIVVWIWSILKILTAIFASICTAFFIASIYFPKLFNKVPTKSEIGWYFIFVIVSWAIFFFIKKRLDEYSESEYSESEDANE